MSKCLNVLCTFHMLMIMNNEALSCKSISALNNQLSIGLSIYTLELQAACDDIQHAVMKELGGAGDEIGARLVMRSEQSLHDMTGVTI